MAFISRDALVRAQKVAQKNGPQCLRYGRRLGRWCWSHKALVLVAGFFFYTLLSQIELDRHLLAVLVPSERTSANVEAPLILADSVGPPQHLSASNRSKANISTTRSSEGSLPTTEPAGSESAQAKPVVGIGGIPIDTGESLPAQLNSKELKRLVREVDHLARTLPKAHEEVQQETQLLNDVTKVEVIQNLWGSMARGGFKDRQLPLDWYACVQDDLGLFAILEQLATYTATETAFQISETYLLTAQARVIGGKPTIADVGFIRLTQVWVDSKTHELERKIPLMRQVIERLRVEYPETQGPPSPAVDGPPPGIIQRQSGTGLNLQPLPIPTR